MKRYNVSIHFDSHVHQMFLKDGPYVIESYPDKLSEKIDNLLSDVSMAINGEILQHRFYDQFHDRIFVLSGKILQETVISVSYDEILEH